MSAPRFIKLISEKDFEVLQQTFKVLSAALAKLSIAISKNSFSTEELRSIAACIDSLQRDISLIASSAQFKEHAQRACEAQLTTPSEGPSHWKASDSAVAADHALRANQ